MSETLPKIISIGLEIRGILRKLDIDPNDVSRIELTATEARVFRHIRNCAGQKFIDQLTGEVATEELRFHTTTGSSTE